MDLIVCLLIGIAIGAVCGLFFYWQGRARLRSGQREVDSQAKSLRDLRDRIFAKQIELNERTKALDVKHRDKTIELAAQTQAAHGEIETLRAQVLESQRQLEAKNLADEQQWRAKVEQLEQWSAGLKMQADELAARKVSYAELQEESVMLKRDLRNIDLYTQQTKLEHLALAERQRQLDERSEDLAKRYLRDTVKAIGSSLNANNYAACKDRLVDVIHRCREAGFNISDEQEQAYVAQLKSDYELVVRAAIEREEQARIKAQIREEEKVRREMERAIEQANRERLAVQAALDQALAAARDKHSEEVELLRAKLAEAESRTQRAMSMAEQTKAGNVYVISNIGSFGKDVFKIGMTRRLEPLDRIRELGDASVPFPFDVHMMISCTDAPSLENALHRALHQSRLNRVNPRREFFRTDMEAILKVVRSHHGEVEYTADPEALQYNQSLAMSAEDAEYIESVFDAAEADQALPATD